MPGGFAPSGFVFDDTIRVIRLRRSGGVSMIDLKFTTGLAPEIMEMADVDGSGEIDIADLVYFVDFMFTGGPAPVNP